MGKGKKKGKGKGKGKGDKKKAPPPAVQLDEALPLTDGDKEFYLIQVRL